MIPSSEPLATHLLWRSALAVAFITVSFLLSNQSHAQSIKLDGSLGPRTTLTGPNYAIPHDLGQTRGANLFHSFEQFSILTGESAIFTGPNTIQRVISRVTGGVHSFIDGLLGTDFAGAKPEFYLVNPSGLMFGPNASLNVSGSIHFSTADVLRMVDDARFYSTLGVNESVLSVETVAAFGFLGPAPAALALQSSNLQAPTDKTISIVGGDVSLTAGRIRVSNGKVLIGSVASAGELTLTAAGIESDGAVTLGSVTMAGGHQINVRGEGAGTVVIRGGQLTLDNASIVADITIGSQEGGQINIRTQGDMSLLNQARIVTDSDAGRSGDIHIEAQTLLIRDGSQIRTVAEGDAPAGDISIVVKALELTNEGRVTSSSNTEGNVGNLTVLATESVLLSGNFRTRVSADSTLFSGAAGQVLVTTPRLQIDGGQISAETLFGTGTGGNIDLNVGSLEITNGGVISSGTSGTASAGTITIAATESVSLANFGSDIISNTSGSGDGGLISITSPRLAVTDHGLIQASTFRSGNAGSIAIAANQLELRDGALISNDALFTLGGPSSGKGGSVTVFATESMLIANHTGDPLAVTGLTSSTFGSGKAGTISVSAPTLTMDNGRITADTLGTGAAGDIELQGANIALMNGARITSDASFGSTGRGGNVQVTASETLTIAGRSLDGRNFQSQIAASTFGNGDGGAVMLSAATLAIEDGIVRALTNGPGHAGSLSLVVGDLMLVGGAQVDSTTRASGSGGALTIHASNSVIISGKDQAAFPSGLFSGTEGSGNAGPLAVTTPTLTMTDGGVISTKSTGTGIGGSMTVTADTIFLTGTGTKLTAETTSSGGAAALLADLGVTLDILHTFDGDLVAELISPAGSSVVLFSGVGGGGRNFSETRLDDRGATPIASGIAPFTGTFLPQQPLTTLIGEPANGLWKLNVTDTALFDTGTLLRWSLSLGESVFPSADVPKPIPDLTTTSSILNVEAGPGALIQAVAQPAVQGGDGGNIVVHAQIFTIQDGAMVLASTKGSGRGGSIFITSDQTTLGHGARIGSDSTSAVTGAGNAGTVSVTAAGTLALTAGSVTTEAAEGLGGDIALRAQAVILNEGAVVSTRSTGSGNSGNILIVANDLFQSQSSQVTTEATQAFGGNIDIQTQRMIQLTGSQILTSVQSGAGDGGNITIDPQFLILDNTQILAQAVAGNGGNISIVAGTMMVSPGSLINASSQTGISGQVAIQAPVTNLASALTRLTQTPLNATELLTARCAARLREGRTSSLTVAGRDGVPAELGSWRPTAFLTAGLRPTTAPIIAARSALPTRPPLLLQSPRSEFYALRDAAPLPLGCGS